MDHKKKKSVTGNLFGHSNSSPNLKSYLKEDSQGSLTEIPENEEVSTSNLQKVHSTPTSPLSINNNNQQQQQQQQQQHSLNSSGNSIGSNSPSTSYQNSPVMGNKKKPSRLVQAFKRVKHNNKLKKEIEELSNRSGLNQQYTRENLPFNMIQGDASDDLLNTSGGGGHSRHGSTTSSNHSRQNSKLSKKHQRKSRFIEPVSQSTEDYTDIPRIIKVSIEYLFEKCLKVPGLFRESANALELQRLSQIFEKGEEIDLSNYNDPHCIGGLLKLYFRERPTPIFPYDLHKKIYNVLNEEDSSNKIRELLESGIPKGQYLILRYLFELLNSVHNNQEFNKMNYQNLAICFAPSLIQSYDTSCIDVIERLIDQYEAIFSVVVMVLDSTSNNGGSIDLSSSSPLKIDGEDNNTSNNYQVVLDSSDTLEQIYNGSSNSGYGARSSINTSNGIKRSPLLSPNNSGNSYRKSISPKLNNRKSVNINKLSSDTLAPPLTSINSDTQDENENENDNEEGEILVRPRKNSSTIYISSRLRSYSRNRPNSWNHNKKQTDSNKLNPQQTIPTKRLHSVNSIDYNKTVEPFDKTQYINSNGNSSTSPKKSSPTLKSSSSSINKQLFNSPGTPESDCTSITSDEDEELKIISSIKPISRSTSMNNLVEEVNKLNMDINSTNNQDGSLLSSSLDNNNNNNNIILQQQQQSVPTTNYSSFDKPVNNYNRFLQPANRSVSNPSIKNFSIPASSQSSYSKYSKRSPTLFSPQIRKPTITGKKNTYSGTPSPSFNSSSGNTTPSSTPSLSTQSSKNDLHSSVSSLSSTSSINSNISSVSSNVSVSSTTTTTTTTTTTSSSSVSGHHKTPSTSSSSVSSSANTIISPIKKSSHQHTNSLTSPSIGSAASSNSSSPNLTSSTPSSSLSTSGRPTLNHTVSASTLISKFNQIDNQSTQNNNWKGSIEKNKQAPVKKSVALFEKKS